MSAVVTHRRPGGSMAWFIAVGIALAALNLRTAVTSVGTVMDEVSAGLGMSAAATGLLTTLPVLCFAIFGALTPALSRRVGEHALLLGAIVLLGAGQAVRAVVDSAVPFLAASAVALAGGAVGNVVIPALIKRHFPRRGGAMTTVYSTALAVGTMVAAAATVPVQQAAGGNWHVALGVWAALAAVAVIPWLALARRSEPERRSTHARAGRAALLRSRLAWAVAGYFGSQSLIAYVMFGWLPLLLRDNGYTSGQAAVILAVFTGLGIPISLAVPPLATRLRDQRPLVAAFVVLYAVGFAGLLSGHALWASSMAVAVGMGSFPLALSMLALRTRSGAATAALSAFGQSTGYLIAGAGPITFGLLHQVSGGWALPFGLLFAAVAVQLVTGWYAGGERTLEDEGRAVPAGPDPEAAERAADGADHAADHAEGAGGGGHASHGVSGPVAGHPALGIRDLVAGRHRTSDERGRRSDGLPAAGPRQGRRTARAGRRRGSRSR
ncbi:CynX/NimT family MFS transporter [Microbispora corallina]|nr:MFS transporter [Microbispora corallina]